jgi:hypothetical protein
MVSEQNKWIEVTGAGISEDARDLSSQGIPINQPGDLQ